MIKICVWTCDMTARSYFGKMNSTLGSVVPLAMFYYCNAITAKVFDPRYTPNCSDFTVRDEYLINLIPFLWGLGLWCVLTSFSKHFSHEAGYRICKISSFYHPFISFSGCFIYHLLFRFNIAGRLFDKSHPLFRRPMSVMCLDFFL